MESRGGGVETDLSACLGLPSQRRRSILHEIGSYLSSTLLRPSYVTERQFFQEPGEIYS